MAGLLPEKYFLDRPLVFAVLPRVPVALGKIS
jgi:hypothetical protein